MNENATPPRVLRVLMSYYYSNDCSLSDVFGTNYPGRPVEIILDSGAFSAFTLGAKIDEDRYFDWVEMNKKSIAAAVALDVIGDAKKSVEAAERMLKRFGDQFPIIPAFHMGSDLVYLKTICGLSDYIALGGMIPFMKHRAILVRWLRSAFELIPPTHRVHAFGTTTSGILALVPWHSADSSTFASTTRFAALRLFDRNKRECRLIDLRSKRSILNEWGLLHQYTRDLGRIQLDQTLAKELYVRSYWRMGDALGVKLYFAFGGVPTVDGRSNAYLLASVFDKAQRDEELAQ